MLDEGGLLFRQIMKLVAQDEAGVLQHIMRHQW